ncbi:MAG: hypothetical protein RLN75_06805 [Longimicrobiales bacterium]
MGTWWPSRRLAAAVAVATVVGTALGAVGPGAVPWLAALYVAVAVFGLGSPAAIPVQVVAGVSLVAGLLVRSGGESALALAPLVAGVVATAELLAVVARLDAPIERPAGDLLLRAGGSAALAGGLYAGVLLAGAMPGPEGLAAVALGSGGALLAALVLVRRQHGLPPR